MKLLLVWLVLCVAGPSLLWRLILKVRTKKYDQRNYVSGYGEGHVGFSFQAEDDPMAADVLLAIVKADVPREGHYKIEWLQKRTPGR